MKKLLLLTVLLIANYSFSQKNTTASVSREGKSNNGIYGYRANVEFQVRPEGLLVDVIVSRNVTNYEITSYTYKNINATEVGYSFPIKVNSFKKKAFVDIQFYKGTVSYTARNLEPNGLTYLSDVQLKNLFNTFNIDPKKRDCITCDAIKEVKALNIRAYNVRLEDLEYNDIFSEINTKIDKLIYDKKIEEQNTQKINSLKSEISNLSNSKEDLQKKKQLYVKLATIDDQNSYSDEISKIENEIEKINKESEKEETKEDAQEDAQETSKKEKERATEKEKQDAEDRETKRKAEEKERIQKKVENYRNKKTAANNENSRIASASAASTASVLYLLGGVIYSNMGSNNGQIFGEGLHNLHFGLDFGYSATSSPIYFSSNYENIYEPTGEIYYVEKMMPSQTYTINLGLKAQLAMEGDYYRAEGYTGIRGGLSPFFDAFHSNFFYGFQASGGLPFVKAIAGMEWSNRSFSKSDILDSQEYGEGKTSYGTTSLKLGMKFSWYGYRKYARNHISFGVINEQITSLDDDVFLENINTSRKPGSTLVGDVDIYNKESDFSTYTGYFFEWRKDHHGTLTIEFFPTYPHTGERAVKQYDPSDWSSHGSFYLNIGFTRNFDWFNPIKK